MIISILLIMVLAMVLTACTNKTWYEGVQEGARNCRSQPPSEVDACMEKLNTKTYEEYEKERAGQK